jgi:hypothetical protein
LGKPAVPYTFSFHVVILHIDFSPPFTYVENFFGVSNSSNSLLLCALGDKVLPRLPSASVYP